MEKRNVEWLSEREVETWMNVWSFHVWLPARLEAQLKRDAGISHYDYFALTQLWQAPDHLLRMSELASACDMTLSHLSRVITRLEKQEFVRRLPDPDDGRSTLAELTESGLALFEQAAPGHVSEVRRLIFDNLEPEEQQQFGDAMSKIVAAMGTGEERIGR
ncbi:MarR family winged helix-turn-helix transcriptional regulator [Corynebacterium sp.]|uniref:MarR family winged helix-turn-helix transcriptional regulator n=1 Tax=Corynebacterium sp. TaxID=1720 RepID=UPI0026DF0ED6|nr:MarR family transcriptional regulator [Corynebacterium sp.]MDO5512234.1 MarR family transcriptional regulator [Corynebacterium sp.]